MPVCCRCNGRGRCKSCACAKSGSRCVDCLPSRKGHCSNQDPASDAGPEQEHSQRLSPSLMSPSTTITATATATTLEAETEKDLDSPDFVAMLDDVITVPSSHDYSFESEVHQAHGGSLPSFRPAIGTEYTWGDLSGQVFTSLIDDAYSQIVHWRSNLFKVPSGSSGKRFVAELSRLYEAFATESALECVALTAAMTLPALMLQKPHAKSKVQEHIACLQRRLSLWEKGEIAELLKEGRAIQKALQSSMPPQECKR